MTIEVTSNDCGDNDEDDNDGGEDNISGKIHPPEQGVHP